MFETCPPKATQPSTTMAIAGENVPLGRASRWLDVPSPFTTAAAIIVFVFVGGVALTASAAPVLANDAVVVRMWSVSIVRIPISGDDDIIDDGFSHPLFPHRPQIGGRHHPP